MPCVVCGIDQVVLVFEQIDQGADVSLLCCLVRVRLPLDRNLVDVPQLAGDAPDKVDEADEGLVSAVRVFASLLIYSVVVKLLRLLEDAGRVGVVVLVVVLRKHL